MNTKSNKTFGEDTGYVGTYLKTNLGHTISHFDGIFDDGAANVSALSILELDSYFPSLTVKDFEQRGNSSYTLVGDKFNLVPPSIQNPVTFSSSQGSIGGPIVVQDTNNFPNSGYLFHSIKGIPSSSGLSVDQRRFIDGSVDLTTTTDPKFGDRCVFLNEDAGSNNGEYLSVINAELGSGNFTISFWFKPDTDPNFPYSSNLLYFGSPATSGIQFGSNNNRPYIGFDVWLDNTNSATPTVRLWNGQDQSIRNAGTCNRGSWNHLALERLDGELTVYLNGVGTLSQPNTQDYSNGQMGNNTNPYFAIGFDNITSVYDGFHGFIDNIHVQSAAAYAGLPATYEQPNSYTILLENFDTPSNTYAGVIQYTSKTATSFEGCTYYNGENVIANGSEVIPFTI